MIFLLFRRAWLLLLVGWLAGCASVPPGRPAAGLGLDNFFLSARFSVRVEDGGAPRSASGRLEWQRAQGLDRLLLQGPLGAGMAEIRVDAMGAELRTGRGEVRRAPDADALLAQVTGYALPVGRLAGWLFARPGPDGRLTYDGLGRPQRLLEAGWQVDYRYANDAADALPEVVEVVREAEMTLRLRIESWGG